MSNPLHHATAIEHWDREHGRVQHLWRLDRRLCLHSPIGAVCGPQLRRLQVEADGGNQDAVKVLELRKSANQILATVVWGNVSTNVLLTLLSGSVLHGVVAFFFSTFAITMLGEIVPQAYFSRNALMMTSRFLPFLNFYRVLLYPLA